MTFTFGETFARKIKINDDNFYVVAWSISVAKKIIKKFNLALIKLSLNKIINVVDQRYINDSRLGFALNNNASIILASYPSLAKNKFLIIDGNHRVLSKYQDGQKNIQGYMLEPQHHSQSSPGNG